MIIQGRNIAFFANNGEQDVLVANSDSGTLSISATTIPICARGSSYQRMRCSTYGWGVEVSGLYVDTNSIDIPIGQPINVIISVLWGDLTDAVSPLDLAPNTSVMLRGEALISSASCKGERGSMSRWDVTMTGNGGLTVGVPQQSAGFPYIFPLVF